MRKFVALGTIAAMALGAQSAAAQGFSYNYIEGSYIAQAEVGPADADGFGVSGAFELTSNLFAFGGLNNVSEGGNDLDELNLGLGFNYGLADNLDLVAGASFERVKAGSSESGFGVGLGLRGRVAERLELTGGVKYRDIGPSDGTEFSVGGRWYFTENFAAGADFRRFDLGGADGNWISIGLRYDFGNRL